MAHWLLETQEELRRVMQGASQVRILGGLLLAGILFVLYEMVFGHR